MVEPITREAIVAGDRIVYDEYGDGDRVVLMIHGLLLNRRMHAPLARRLAGRHGYRVISIDLLGHGESDRPNDLGRYSMPIFGEQVVDFLDEVGIDEVVTLGTSLGANVSLEVAARAPERLRGMVVEMPVLDNALLGCAIAFTPLLINMTFGAPIWNRVYRPVVRLLKGRNDLIDVAVEWIDQDPGPSSAVMQGLFFGRTAPPRGIRRLIPTDTLIIGHERDPVHPFSDADMLLGELENARLVKASSIMEMRLQPKRLSGEISAFLESCWAPEAAAANGSVPAAATTI